MKDINVNNKLDDLLKSVEQLHRKIDVNAEKTTQLYKKMFGNGRRGLCERFDLFEGQLSVWKWLAGGSGVVAIILASLEILERL